MIYLIIKMSTYILTALSILYTATRWSQIPDDLESGSKYAIGVVRKVQPVISTFVNVCYQKCMKECQRRGYIAEPAPPPRPPKLVKKEVAEPERQYANIFDAPLNY
jgi:hypothetical protein